MSKAFLYGYYGMHNAGDNALLLAAAWGARHYLHTEDFTVNSPSTFKLPVLGHIDRLIREKQLFRGQNRLHQYGAAWKNDHLIFGGGSVLHCARDIRHMRHLCSLNQGMSLALGVGLGPFKNAAAERECKKFLERCDFIGLRDKHSYRVAKELAPNAHTELTFDLAPMLLSIPSLKAMPSALHPVSTVSQNPEESTNKRRGIAVALCPVERFKGDFAAETHRLKALARSLALVHALTGEPIYLFDFNGHKSLGDSAVHKQLKQLIPSKVPVIYYHYQSNPVAIIEKFKRMRAVIAMRLHAAVFGYLASTPTLTLSYHSKCDGWNDQIALPENHRFDAFAINEMKLQKVLLDGLSEGFAKPGLTHSRALQKSLKNFCLDQFSMEEALCLQH
ncbi:polysaccharide pyruvyl transferase family protein [Pseudoteredinibacter isoporae]|uniref:Polysaccharide pyruvyl transferase WcaK-like protein n=1 Tax=Pseudoteredinibacter isoporae TaxID=570281 RepID=A0A7X0MWT5_9GAMM|nr:polysaccharide pyruvyl transferase family protein [Pseudoteredinibacter isoporae]MBB6523066.1 polysaccharide pyruvyl transferase WcaK-like protein [Pseudoteredinibacter isoporae]NHO88586.1 polysaccharide pyruvyl transferase family protein [Pseudoteredinibacter isoporae]NIB22723.1 polysaccharide pyruvyl transferase family protein [Pseudoteredinibacter isoporae]